MSAARKRIILINPSLKPVSLPTLPRYLSLGLLSIASGIAERYTVSILDRTVAKDDAQLRQLLQDPAVCCAGISAMTGPVLRDALHCSRLIREMRPDVAVVWGGWHVTMAPESVLRKSCVDYIIQGEGEAAFAQLVDAIAEGKPGPLEIPGVGCRIEGKNHLCPPAPPLDMDTLPPIPLDIAPDIEPYIVHNWVPGGGRCLPWETSRGCPCGCAFCEISAYFGAVCHAKTPKRMVEEIAALVQRYQIGGVRFYNPNFFFRMENAKRFARLILERGLDLKWACEGTIQQFRRASMEDLQLFQKAGLRSVFFGIESGNERIRRDVLKKPFSNRDCQEVAAKFQAAGIQFKFSLILGLPGETLQDTFETLDFAIDMLDRYPNSSLGGHMFLYIPMPGTPLAREAHLRGLPPLETLEDYARIDYATGAWMPWLDARHARLAGIIATMSYFLSASRQDIPLTGVWKALFRFLQGMYRFRMRHHLLWKTPDIALLQRVLH